MIAMRMLSLCTLSLQSSLLILTMRYSRMNNSPYSTTSSIFLTELLKLGVCIYGSTRSIGLRRTFEFAIKEDSLNLAIPAALYVLQNHLQFFAAERLEASTLQVAYQLKILTTALFFVWFLRKSLKYAQWAALVLLTVGVVIMQYKHHAKEQQEQVERLFGLGAVVLVCLLSGAASVYFEKCVKYSRKNTSADFESVSVWIRNIQLGFYSLLPLVLVAIAGNDAQSIYANGWFHNYTRVTYAVILLQAAGGILVANVVKYADSILKNFATSLSIILSTVLSFLLWGDPITYFSMIGALLVILATYWFTSYSE